MTSALTTLQQWLLFSGAILVVGCVAWRHRVLDALVESVGASQTETEGGARAQALSEMESRVQRLALLSVVVLVVAWGLRLVVQVMAFRDPFVPLMEDVSFLLFQVEWGTVWMAQGGVVSALVIAMMLAGRPMPWTAYPPVGPQPIRWSLIGWRSALFLVFGLTTTMAFSGHASGVAEGRALALSADSIHTLAAGTWIGTLFVILTAGRAGGTAGAALFGAQIRAFSPMALVSGGTLVAMGVYLAWQHLTAVSDLWMTTYGQILSGKIAVVAVIFGLGAWNWQKGVPVSDTEEGAAVVRRRAVWEVASAVGVIFLTAILTHSPKP